MSRNVEPDPLSRLLTYMKMMCAWPVVRFWPLLFVPSSIVVSAQVGFIFTGQRDAVSMLQCAREIVTSSCVIIKAWLLTRSAKQVFQVYTFMKTDMKESRPFWSSKAKKIMSRRSRVTNGALNCLQWMYFSMFFSSVVPLFWTHFFGSKESRNFILRIGPEEFWFQSDMANITLLIVYAPFLYHILVGIMTFDTIYFFACHYISSKSMIVSSTVKDIGSHIIKLSTHHSPLNAEDVIPGLSLKVGSVKPLTKQELRFWSASEAEEAIIYAALLHCVKDHQETCKLRDDVEDLCSTLTLFTIAGLVLNITLPILQLYMVEDTFDAKTTVMAFNYAIWAMLQLVLYCAYSEQIFTKDLSFDAYSVYNAGLCSDRILVALKMMMMRAQTPLFLSSGKFFEVNNAASIFIVQRSYSFCAFVWNLR